MIYAGLYTGLYGGSLWALGEAPPGPGIVLSGVYIESPEYTAGMATDETLVIESPTVEVP